MRRAVIIAIAFPCLMGVESAEARLEVLVDKSSQRMVVIQDGRMLYIWPVSTGRDSLATPNGVYVPQRLERSWFSKAYYRSPMPYSIFFHNGYAIHGSSAISKLGGPASHGCVRLHPYHAGILFGLVQQEGPQNTTIEITGDPVPIPAPLPSRDGDARGASTPTARPKLDHQIADLTDLTNGQRSGNRAVIIQGPVPPVPPLIGHRDQGDRIEPATPQRLPLQLAPHHEKADPAVAKQPTGDTHPLATGNSNCPCSATAMNRAADEPAGRHAKAGTVTGPQPEPLQSSYGFKILPKSCWSGASWRWRWRSDQDTQCK
jgi:L,D-transpeptidase catalytic domain